MKVKILVVLSAILILCFVGCGNSAESADSSAVNSEEKESIIDSFSSIISEKIDSLEDAVEEIANVNVDSFAMLEEDGSNNVNQNHEHNGYWSRFKEYCFISDEKSLYVAGTDLGFNQSGVYKMDRRAKDVEYGSEMIVFYTGDSFKDFRDEILSISDREYYAGAGAIAIGFKDEETLAIAAINDVYVNSGDPYEKSAYKMSLYEAPVSEATFIGDDTLAYDEITILYDAGDFCFKPKIVGSWIYYETSSDFLDKVTDYAGIKEDEGVCFCRTSTITGETEVLIYYAVDARKRIETTKELHEYRYREFASYIFDSEGNFAYTFSCGSNSVSDEIFYYDVEAHKSISLVPESASNDDSPYIIKRYMYGFSDDYLYYAENNNLYRKQIDQPAELIFTLKDHAITAEDSLVNFNRNYIFLYADGDRLYVIPKDDIGEDSYPYLRMNVYSRGAYDAGARMLIFSAGMWIWNNNLWIVHGPDEIVFTGISIDSILERVEAGIDYWDGLEESSVFDGSVNADNSVELSIPAGLPISSDWMWGTWYVDGYTGGVINFWPTEEIDGVEYSMLSYDWPDGINSVYTNALAGETGTLIAEMGDLINYETYYDKDNYIVYLKADFSMFLGGLAPGIHVLTLNASQGQDIIESYK